MDQHDNVSKQFCYKRSGIKSLKLQTGCQKAVNKYFFLNFYGPNDTFGEEKLFRKWWPAKFSRSLIVFCVPSVLQ